MNLWLVIIGMGVITYAIRLSMIVMVDRLEISNTIKLGLNFVPPAVLSAIIFPELLQPGGTLDISLGNERLLAGLLAIITAWRSKNILLTIGVGMVSLWLLLIF